MGRRREIIGQDTCPKCKKWTWIRNTPTTPMCVSCYYKKKTKIYTECLKCKMEIYPSIKGVCKYCARERYKRVKEQQSTYEFEFTPRPIDWRLRIVKLVDRIKARNGWIDLRDMNDILTAYEWTECVIIFPENEKSGKQIKKMWDLLKMKAKVYKTEWKEMGFEK